MSTITFYDGKSRPIALDCCPGDTLFATLLGNHIPPLAVRVTESESGTQVSLFETVQPDGTYEARLLERYDIAAMRALYEPSDSPGASARRELRLSPTRLEERRTEYDVAELLAAVEDRLVGIITEYGMIEADNTVVVGYSGGIDSTALLCGLDAVREELPAFDLRILCIDDYWTESGDLGQSPDTELLERVGAEYRAVGPEQLADLYGLTEPVHRILEELRDKGESPLSVASNFNRRLYEQYAEAVGAETICLGSQSTDLIAGRLSDVIQNRRPGPPRFPVHRAGEYRYVHPLAFHTKPELASYVATTAGYTVDHSGFDPWQMTDADTHFYYYLADLLQSYFPGMCYWLSHAGDDSPGETSSAASCRRCGKLKPESGLRDGVCGVCEILLEEGYCS